MNIILIPAVLNTKEAWEYCGGRSAFGELLANHGDVLKIYRRNARGDCSYRRATLDAAMAVAEARGSLVQPLKKKSAVMGHES